MLAEKNNTTAGARVSFTVGASLGMRLGAGQKVKCMLLGGFHKGLGCHTW